MSCVKNDLLTESGLSRTQISFTKRSNAFALSDELSGMDIFYVFGYHTGESLFQDYITSGRTPKSNWMFNQEVKRNETGDFVYSPVSYWPLNENDKITFLSYTLPATGRIDQISPDPITKEGEPIFKYTTETENPTGDFMVSQPTYDLTRKDGSVRFYMQHVLSRIRFNIKSTSTNIRIKSIGLSDVYTEGEFLAHGRIWRNLNNKTTLATYTIPDDEQLLSNEFRLLTPQYIVIPQDFTESEVKPTFTLVFDVNGEEKSYEFIPSKDWEIYNSYTYNLTYSAGDLEVETNYYPWIEDDIEDGILANQYLNVSTREIDLANSHHFYYNSSFPRTSIYQIATYADKSEFNLYDFFNIYYEGNKIRLQAQEDKDFEAEAFTIYLQGLDLHDHVLVRLPINVKTESGGEIEIDGTFWAPGNIIYHDGHLEIAPNANYTGLYFRWGSLIGLAGNNAKSFQFIPDKSIGFRPSEYTGKITKWDEVPYEHTMHGKEYNDAFSGRYVNQLGFDATKALGDPCRYMCHQKGWTKGKWRMPTKAEYEAIVQTRKIRRINGTWGIANESHEHISASTGTLPVEAGWFVKADLTDNTIPPDEEFNTVKPPKGWVFYPAAGERSGYTGSLSQYSSLGYYWTSTTVSWDAAYRFQFSKTDTGNNPGSFSDIASGFVDAYTVRCVRDTN